MGMGTITKKTLPVLLIFFALTGTDGSAEQVDERKQLMERKDQLQGRIEELEREQGFLLFQKEMYVSDSKYLVLDFSSRRGDIKYRNRVLKTFHFSSPVSPAGRAAPPPGVLVLTKKTETPNGKRVLLFGDSFIIQVKRSAKAVREDTELPRIFLARKDMASLFYVVEEGSLAYIIR